MYSNIVYVAGCENNGTTEVVKYWKNERALALTGIFVLIHKTNEYNAPTCQDNFLAFLS